MERVVIISNAVASSELSVPSKAGQPFDYGQGQDMFAYISWGVTVTVNIPPDAEVFSETHAEVYCFTGAAYALYDSWFDQYFKHAQTLVRYTGTESNCENTGFNTVC